jgi:hypothetical protein
MATIANEVYASAPRDPLAPAGVNPCAYTAALDTVRIPEGFHNLRMSAQNHIGTTGEHIHEHSRVAEES